MFTKAFWSTALEAVLATFGITFAASLKFTTSPSLGGLETAAIAGGMAALYVFIKQVGGTQALTATPKVTARAKHAAQNSGR